MAMNEWFRLPNRRSTAAVEGVLAKNRGNE